MWAWQDDEQQADLEREKRALAELRQGLVMPDSRAKVELQIAASVRHLARLEPDGQAA